MAVSPPLDRCSDAFVPFPWRDGVHEGKQRNAANDKRAGCTLGVGKRDSDQVSPPIRLHPPFATYLRLSTLIQGYTSMKRKASQEHQHGMIHAGLVAHERGDTLAQWRISTKELCPGHDSLIDL